MSLRIASINICGLNDLKKRQRAAEIFKIMRVDILCVQETHIEDSRAYLLEQLGFKLIVNTKQGTRTRGVAILSRRNDIAIKRRIADKWGRWVVVECKWQEEMFTLCSIYGSTGDDPEVLELLDVELATWPSPVIFCGDFNINGLGGLWGGGGGGSSYLGRKKRVYRALTNLVQNNALIDIWAQLNPTDPGSTFFSAPHKITTRLDYFFVSHSIKSRCKIEKHPRIISDHNPLVLTLTWGGVQRQEKGWTFERGLLKDPEYVIHMNEWIKGFWEINRGSAGPGIVWDAFKAGVRGETLSYSLGRQKRVGQRMKASCKVLMDVEEELATAIRENKPLEDILLRMAIAKAEMGEVVASKAAEKFLAKREQCYEFSERVGHTLAVRLRQRTLAGEIGDIMDSGGKLIEGSLGIREVFRQFYEDLYREEQRGEPRLIQEYLKGILKHSIDSEDRAALDIELTQDEIYEALGSLPAGKAVGPDLIPLEFYKTFLEAIGPDLVAIIGLAQLGDSVPDSWAGADMIVFLKKGKPPREPGSYRPITLMNSDSKIYSKALSTRLNQIIGRIVHPCQHGFIPGRGTTEHTRRAITLFDIAEVSGDPMALILMDAEKAFDRVSWDYLWEVMKWFGIGTNYIKAIQALYKAPNARIRVNGGYTTPVIITRGTRQGCPCSPLLFALYIDPLLRKLDASIGVSPMWYHGRETKILAYADDVAVVTPNPQDALAAIEEVAQDFGKISGYALNKQKTLIVQNKWAKLVDPRVVDSAVYLGIDITPDLGKLVERNMEPIIRKAKKDFDRLNNLHMTLVGRSNVVKMVFLPKILYLFRAIPLEFEKHWFNTLEYIVNRFIWAHGKTRRAMRYMSLPRERGGWAVPDFKMYYWAAALQYMSALAGRTVADLRDIDTPDIYDLLLGEDGNNCFMKFTEPSYYKKTKFKTLLAAYRIWAALKKKIGLGRFNHYTQLYRNPTFPDIFSDTIMLEWEGKGMRMLGDLIGPDGLRLFSDIQQEYGINTRHFFKYLQVRSFLKGKVGGPCGFQRSVIIDAIRTGENCTIRRIYAELQIYKLDDLDKYEKKWSEKLGIGQNCFSESLEMGQSILCSAGLQAQHFKTIFWLYHTPARIAQWGGQEGIRCPRCDSSDADLTHMFATCSFLVNLTKAIEKFMDQTLNIQVILDPALILLGTQWSGRQNPYDYFLFLAMAALRIIIASAWLDQAAPSFQQWLTKLLAIYNLEKGIYERKGKRGKILGRQIWGPIYRWKEVGNDS